MIDPLEIERRASDQIRWAKVDSRDGDTVRVRAGDLVSGPIPWFALRAGDTVIKSPPSIGEQGLLLCPEGDIRLGMFLPGVRSNTFPLPAEDLELIRFEDGAQVAYDAQAHVLTVSLPAGGKVQLVADVAVQGDVEVSGDVKAAGVSLKSHPHKDVQPGAGLSGEPVAS